MHDDSDLPFAERIAPPKWVDQPPTVAAGEFSAWLPRHRKSASVARGMLREFLATRADGELYIDVGELVLSELVTNAIRHGRTSPGRLVFVRFELTPGLLRVEVHDANSDRPTARRVSADEESGRGMWLVEQLSKEWGCCPRAGRIGKAVWCAVGPTNVGAP